PGLVLSSRAGAPVRGEIYRVDNPGTLWPILDAYEDCDPGQPTLSEYRREKIPVTAGPGRTLAAWTYLYNGPVAGRRRILSGDYARLSRAGRSYPRPLSAARGTARWFPAPCPRPCAAPLRYSPARPAGGCSGPGRRGAAR